MDQRFWNAHPHLAWAMWGYDEIEAALGAIENRILGRTDLHATASNAIADMRTARDHFRKSIVEHGQTAEPSFADMKSALEDQWEAFENSVQTYLALVDNEATEQETLFRARASAQNRTWRKAIDELHLTAKSLAADRRHNIEAAIALLEAEAEAATTKVDKLNKAEDASWLGMKSALADTRAALDRAHRAVLKELERAA